MTRKTFLTLVAGALVAPLLPLAAVSPEIHRAAQWTRWSLNDDGHVTVKAWRDGVLVFDVTQRLFNSQSEAEKLRIVDDMKSSAISWAEDCQSPNV